MTTVERYALLGKKLGHSFSKAYFTEKFEREGRAAQYENIELPDEAAVAEFLTGEMPYQGMNVTIPWKEALIPHLAGMDELAAGVGAVNCIRVEGGELWGHNTDCLGFRDSLGGWLDPQPKRVLILGTGGAAKAVAFALRQWWEPKEISLVSRSPEGEDQLSYGQLAERDLGEFDLIVNTTPVGMWPHTDQAPAIAYGQIQVGQHCYDLIYNPSETLFLQQARAQGAKVQNGREMLVRQAEWAWSIWQGK